MNGRATLKSLMMLAQMFISLQPDEDTRSSAASASVSGCRLDQPNQMPGRRFVREPTPPARSLACSLGLGVCLAAASRAPGRTQTLPTSFSSGPTPETFQTSFLSFKTSLGGRRLGPPAPRHLVARRRRRLDLVSGRRLQPSSSSSPALAVAAPINCWPVAVHQADRDTAAAARPTDRWESSNCSQSGDVRPIVGGLGRDNSRRRAQTCNSRPIAEPGAPEEALRNSWPERSPGELQPRPQRDNRDPPGSAASRALISTGICFKLPVQRRQLQELGFLWPSFELPGPSCFLAEQLAGLFLVRRLLTSWRQPVGLLAAGRIAAGILPVVVVVVVASRPAGRSPHFASVRGSAAGRSVDLKFRFGRVVSTSSGLADFLAADRSWLGSVPAAAAGWPTGDA